jgi:hypothetical protein
MSKGLGRTQRNIIRVLHAPANPWRRIFPDGQFPIRVITLMVYPELGRRLMVEDADAWAARLRSTVARALDGLWLAGLVTKYAGTATHDYRDAGLGQLNKFRVTFWELTGEGHARAETLGETLDRPSPHRGNWALEPYPVPEDEPADDVITRRARHFGEGESGPGSDPTHMG